MSEGRDSAGRFIKGSKINQGCVHSEERRLKHSVAMTGRTLTDEHKAKIKMGMENSEKSIGRPKGGIPWNKGMKRENGDPIPIYVYGERSEEAKNNMSKARLGKHYSPATEVKKGSIGLHTGHRHSLETIDKMSIVHQNISEETRIKMSTAKKGKHHSAEIIKKMLSRRTPTSLEKKFQDIINKYKLPYKFTGDGSFMIGRKNPDFININGEKIAIEVYAKYYKLLHAETIKEWQDDRKKVFAEYGWSVIFFDETEVKEKNVLSVLSKAA
jgi:very-short-patch-repair endonuclease